VAKALPAGSISARLRTAAESVVVFLVDMIEILRCFQLQIIARSMPVSLLEAICFLVEEIGFQSIRAEVHA